MLTKSKEFLPIQAPPMVVEDCTTGVWPILPRPDRHAARLRPPALNAFTIHATGALRVVDVILDLTAFSVARQVKLRNDNLPVIEGVKAEGGGDGILGNS